MKTLISAAAAAFLVSTAAADVVFRGAFWKDSGAVYGDGRIPDDEARKTPSKAPHGHILDYTFDVPADGWYAPLFKGGAPTQDYAVDGVPVAMTRPCGVRDADGFAPGPSLWLRKGRRSLRLSRFGRRGFPMQKFDFFEIRPVTRSSDCLISSVAGHDVVRLGEDVVFDLTGGSSGGTGTYTLEFARRGDRSPDAWKKAGEASFPAGAAPVVRRVNVRLPAEGMYVVRATCGGEVLGVNIFPLRQVVVIDTSGQDGPTRETAAPVPVCTIDCVERAPDAEANGPTRVTRRGGLSYRESHDCSKDVTGPYDGNRPENLSGFSYKVKVPAAQVPYILEVTFPDDERRSVCIRHDWVTPGTDRYLKENSGYQTKSWETGGFFPLSGEMKTQRQIIWPRSTEGRVSVINQSAGTRAACATITISRFPGDTPSACGRARAGGRTFAYWSEEGDSFRGMLCAPDGDYLEAARRWFGMIRFYGGNAVSGMGVAYQSAFWRSNALEGVDIPPFSKLRMFALLGEKYGMSFIPEWFMNQWAQKDVLFPARASGGASDVFSLNSCGTVAGGGVNPLSPVVQETYVAAMKEIFDEIGDSPAFKGLTVRSDTWQFMSQFFFRSLNWGYNDCIVRAFSQETGVKVPPGDAAARFRFLTAPGMKERWVAWRCGKIAAYHDRILDALRGGGRRKDVFFGIAGLFNQESLYRMDATVAERALGSGVDIGRWKNGDGFCILPVARYGSRTPGAGSRAIYDAFFQEEAWDAGRCAPRAFASYMTYMELASRWPARALGFDLKSCRGRVPYHCSGVNAAGRNALERFAVVLAEQDTQYFREGGNADSFGSQDVFAPWLAEFTRLPSVPFERVADDPVTVRHAEEGGSYWWYAVNKERFATTATVRFSDGSSETLELAPFDLKVFCEKGTRRIVSAAGVYPERERAKVLELLACARSLSGSGAGAAFDAALAEAEKAARANRWWRARVELSKAPMYRAYAAAGHIPGEVLRVAFPDKLDISTPKNGHWRLCTPTLSAAQLDAGKSCVLRASSDVNPDWRGEMVLWSAEGDVSFTLDVPAEGRYSLVLGVVSEKKGRADVAVNGAALPGGYAFGAASTPVTAAFQGIPLVAGKASVKIRADAGAGVYGVRLLPSMRPIPGGDWAAAGPYEKYWGDLSKKGSGDEALKAGFDDLMKKELSTCDWRYAVAGMQDRLGDRGLNMAMRVGSTGFDRIIARTTVTSDRERTATLIVAVDWWARVTLNGETVKTDVAGGGSRVNGCNYWGWYPMWTGVVRLRKGRNDLVAYVNGGSLGSALCAWITDDEGITTSSGRGETEKKGE